MKKPIGVLNFGIVSWNEQLSSEPMNHDGFYYFATYMDLCYYTGFLPFRLVYNKTTGRYEVYRSGLQKVLCIIFHMSYVLYSFLCHGYKMMNRKKDIRDPLQFFIVADSLIEVIYILVISYTIFWALDKLDAFLELIQKKYKIPEQAACKKYTVGFCIFTFLWLFSLFLQIEETSTVQAAIADMTIKIPISESYSGSEFKQPNNNSDINERTKLLSPLGATVQLILHLFLAYNRAVYETITVIYFAFGIYLRDLCESLRLKIASGKKSSDQILDCYLHIKDINTYMDSICGISLLSYVVGSIPFFAKILMNLGSYSLFFTLRVISLGAQYSLSMISSASANAKAVGLKDEFLRQKAKGLYKSDPEGCLTLQVEFSSPVTIGLKGLNFFIGTYEFFGLVLSQCVVYALILLQLRGCDEG